MLSLISRTSWNLRPRLITAIVSRGRHRKKSHGARSGEQRNGERERERDEETHWNSVFPPKLHEPKERNAQTRRYHRDEGKTTTTPCDDHFPSDFLLFRSY